MVTRGGEKVSDNITEGKPSKPTNRKTAVTFHLKPGYDFFCALLNMMANICSQAGSIFQPIFIILSLFHFCHKLSIDTTSNIFRRHCDSITSSKAYKNVTQL